MIQCPSCRAMIPDDSAFCDQCGTELMWCPECKRPKPNRGRECPVCGSDLVAGRKYLNGNSAQPAPQHPQQPADAPQSTAISGAGATAGPSKIVGNGWVLPLREGQFGRTSGIYPEFASCKYISGNHGAFARAGAGWTVVDNGSTNGTFVNGQRLTTDVGVPLRIGDTLTIATIDFKVQ